MAKETILREKGSGEVMYPRTMAALVRTAGGSDVERELAELPLKVFVDMWLERGLIYSGTSTDEATLSRHRWSQYDPVGHPDEPFGLDGMWLSYSEAVTVMAVPDVVLWNETTVGMRHFSFSRARTLFPVKGSIGMNLGSVFGMMPNLEVVRVMDYYIINNGADPDTSPQRVNNTRDMITLCPRLREVRGVLKLIPQDSLGRHFYGVNATALETIWLQGVCLSMDLSRWGKLRVECVAYMVEHAANTSAITITLHPEVYAGLTDDIIAKAAEKDISFATV